MRSLRPAVPGQAVRLLQRGLAFRKHPHTKGQREVIQKYRSINAAHEEAATASGLPWRIVGSTYYFNLIELESTLLICACRILHRYPTILVTPEDWEIDMYELQEKVGAKRREVL